MTPSLIAHYKITAKLGEGCNRDALSAIMSIMAMTWASRRNAVKVEEKAEFSAPWTVCEWLAAVPSGSAARPGLLLPESDTMPEARRP
jgi:hypothetical protein